MSFRIPILLALAGSVCALISCDRSDERAANANAAPLSPNVTTRPSDAAAVRDLLNVKTPESPPAPGPGNPTTANTPTVPQMPAGAGTGPRYVAPDSWKSQPPGSRLRIAQFALPAAPGDPDDASCVVTFARGDLEANINRWRGQFNTEDGRPLTDADVLRSNREVNGLKVTIVEIAGRFADPMAGRTQETTTRYRLLGAIVAADSGFYFFKTTGPDATIQAQRENFTKLVDSFAP